MYTVGMYLAERLAQIGLKHHFAVAGDYNLSLLDQLLKNGQMEQIYCCNELNCGFSAEGYARARGAAAAIVTFSVGAISAMNALGGAYAEDLPLILISGSPNTNDYGSGHILHHTIGTAHYHYQLEMVKHITCAAESIVTAAGAPAKIDHVIRTALSERKPAYLEIACNVAEAPCVRPGPLGSMVRPASSDDTSLAAAVEATCKWLQRYAHVVMMIGSKLRAANAREDVIALANQLECAVCLMAGAQSFFPQHHPQFRGLYWEEVSTEGVQSLVETAEAFICIAPAFNDNYMAAPWNSLPVQDNMLIVDADRVTVNGYTFEGITLADFASALALKAPARPRSSALTSFKHQTIAPAAPLAPLSNDEMTRQLESLLTESTTLTVETGDAWFNAARMALPEGIRVEQQMVWSHIGWSIPAAFGNALGAPERRHIVMVGDGSFQLTAQEVAQMIRYHLPVIIILNNNRGYVIEIAIHDGPYNYIKNWDYAGLIQVFNAEDGHGLGLKAANGQELADAIQRGLANTKGPTLIECDIAQDDYTDALKTWGRLAEEVNSRSH